MDLRGARTHVVSDRECAAPGRRRHRALQRGEQRLGIAIGNGQHRNLGEHIDLGERQPLGVLGGADAGSKRVAGVNRHVHDAAALRAVFWTERAFGEDLALEVAVLMRVGIDQASDGAVLGRHFGLDAAPRIAVARDHDGALHGDAQAVERFVVFGDAEVHVNQRRGDVAIDGVGVIDRQLLVVLGRGGVHGNGRFGQLGGELSGR